MKKIIITIAVLLIIVIIFLDIHNSFSIISNLEIDGTHIYTKKSEIEKIISENKQLLDKIFEISKLNPKIYYVDTISEGNFTIACDERLFDSKKTTNYPKEIQKFIDDGGIKYLAELSQKTDLRVFTERVNRISLEQINSETNFTIGVINNK